MKLTDNLYYYPEYGMLDSNTYVIKDTNNIIVDLGSLQFLENLLGDMEADGLKPKDIKIILNTHLHLDHYYANDAFQKLSGAKVLVHPEQKNNYEVSVVRATKAFGIQPIGYKDDGFIDNAALNKSDLQLTVMSTPGHSPCGISIYSRKEKFLICGDLIFHENTGRVDLPGGNAERLKQSIDTISKLDIEYLLPGHMDIVTGATAVKDNFKFVKENVFQWL